MEKHQRTWMIHTNWSYTSQNGHGIDPEARDWFFFASYVTNVWLEGKEGYLGTERSSFGLDLTKQIGLLYFYKSYLVWYLRKVNRYWKYLNINNEFVQSKCFVEENLLLLEPRKFYNLHMCVLWIVGTTFGWWLCICVKV